MASTVTDPSISRIGDATKDDSNGMPAPRPHDCADARVALVVVVSASGAAVVAARVSGVETVVSTVGATAVVVGAIVASPLHAEAISINTTEKRMDIESTPLIRPGKRVPTIVVIN